jgi:hypothetical protein
VKLIGVGAHVLVLTAIIKMIMIIRELVEVVTVVINLLYHFFCGKGKFITSTTEA